MRTKTQKLLIIPDVHFKWHDKKAVKMVLRVYKEWQPDLVVQLGDLVDMYQVSVFTKDGRSDTIQDEIDPANEFLDHFTKSKNYLTMGNHDIRLNKYVRENAPALNGMVSIEKELKLKERDWTVVPYMNHMKLGKVHFTHECGGYGPDAHKKAMLEFNGSVVIGHTHRLSVHYEGNAKGTAHVGAMFGWLGDKSQVHFTHKVKSNKWQLGFGTGLLLKNDTVLLEAHPIVNYTCRVDGVEVRG